MLGDIAVILNVWDRYKKWRNSKNSTISSRFIEVFEAHGIHRNQIPRFLDGLLTIKDIQDDSALLEKLNNELLDKVSTLFSIRREWLEGADSQIHCENDFYKYPLEFSNFIDQIKKENPHHNLRGYLYISDRKFKQNDQAILILEETIGEIGTKAIYRYHLCNNWDFTYWKSRAYLTACIAIASKKGVFIHGKYAPRKSIMELAFGQKFLGIIDGPGFHSMQKGNWFPEDMVLDPDAFLNGVDAEIENYGIKSGLKLWLSLEEKGLMPTESRDNVRSQFENFLKKLN
ncbi:hypothetical protein INP77_00460 [Methylophilus sp. 13]|uniref:hypothetical protein n=1 Tax=Methylophilus sp. 13 TaxID=2781018 RepID=UPI00188FBC36|nr:hypothetical protein [Methylophilus sp. 13]MBF5037953.1 hypothetical protein [Methylophilus sp. 13]